MTKAAVFYDARDGNSIAAAAVVRNKYHDADLFDTQLYVLPTSAAAVIAAMDADYDEAIVAVQSGADYVAEVLATAHVTFTVGAGAAGETVALLCTTDGVNYFTLGSAISLGANTAADMADLLCDSLIDGEPVTGFHAEIDAITPEQINIEAPVGTGATANTYILAVVVDGTGTIAAAVVDGGGASDFADLATGVDEVPYTTGEFQATNMTALAAKATTVFYTWDSGATWTAENTWRTLYPTVMPPRILLFLSYNSANTVAAPAFEIHGIPITSLCQATIEVIEQYFSDIEAYEFAWRKMLDYYGDANNSDKFRTIQDTAFVELVTTQTIINEAFKPLRPSDDK